MYQGDGTATAARQHQVGPVKAGDIIATAFRLCGQHAAIVFGAAFALQIAMLAV